MGLKVAEEFPKFITQSHQKFVNDVYDFDLKMIENYNKYKKDFLNLKRENFDLKYFCSTSASKTEF